MTVDSSAGFIKQQVSVVVPCFNYAHYLRQCLNSVFDQSYSNIQLILIDDGSTDETPEVAQEYVGRLTYIHKLNEGLSAARNTGLEHASGEFILFLDADDILHRHSVRERVKYLQANPQVDIAICGSRNFTGNPFLRSPVGHWYLPEQELELHLAHFNLAPPHAYLLRASAAHGIGLFDPALKACEDYDYWLRAVELGLTIGRSPGMVYYRKHGGSMSARVEQQWRYDVSMHGRACEVYLRRREAISPEAGRSACLALLSGMLITLARTQNKWMSPLLGELEPSIRQVLATLRQRESSSSLSGEDVFYLLRSHQALNECAVKLPLCDEVAAELDAFALSAGVDKLTTRGFTWAFSRSLKSGSAFRFRVLKTAIKNWWY
jgi:GT2 family glycosyltransferase